MALFHELFPSRRPIIGVIDLLPLPGDPGPAAVPEIVRQALEDLAGLERGGLDGVLVQTGRDKPHRVPARAETVATMTRVTREIVLAASTVEVGVEILPNNPEASLAVACVAGARFIRTNYFADRMTLPEHGEMRSDPVGLLEYRSRLGAEGVLILADIQVKYARMLESRSLEDSAALARGYRADAIIVTGSMKGEAPALPEVYEAKRGARECPVLVGSGLDASNAGPLLSVADGAIVGTSLRHADRIASSRVAELMAAITAARAEP